jgi:hypothetical protein
MLAKIRLLYRNTALFAGNLSRNHAQYKIYAAAQAGRIAGKKLMRVVEAACGNY